MTQAEYAKHRGCSAVAVHKAVKAGRITLIDGRIDPAVADIQWAQNTRARVGSAPPPVAADAGADVSVGDGRPGGEDYWAARTRREQAEATMAEMKSAELAGALIRVDAVRAALSHVYVTVREGVLSIPARMAPQMAAESDPARLQSMLHAELHQVLTTLAAAPAQVAPVGDAGEGAA